MPLLRAATTDDLATLESICVLTGDDGADASGTYDQPELLAHHWASPHLAADPSLCTIVVDDDGPVGYLVATADTVAFEAWCERMWWPPLRDRYPLQAPRRDRDQQLVDLMHAPDRTPASVTDAYPAHLHINLLPRAQGLGLGRALIERLVDQLRDRGVAGVHLGVSGTNPRAIAFYEHVGFVRVTTEDDGGIVMGMRLR
ncbi:GNAT family N-acetyltransferase [Microcella sp.]|uniref:GNAT family N-acetyltransferase n=1 Tax=Microcella sp. TaxID=1913979 RepID=UPI002561DD0A|nr:GNAT family N-acetyltransferase [Microcella sp.]MBX9470689.1 GNAT family N-acetyltransferase [Microcella sp.]